MARSITVSKQKLLPSKLSSLVGIAYLATLVGRERRRERAKKGGEGRKEGKREEEKQATHATPKADAAARKKRKERRRNWRRERWRRRRTEWGGGVANPHSRRREVKAYTMAKEGRTAKKKVRFFFSAVRRCGYLTCSQASVTHMHPKEIGINGDFFEYVFWQP